jgi:hypothetical protein
VIDIGRAVILVLHTGAPWRHVIGLGPCQRQNLVQAVRLYMAAQQFRTSACPRWLTATTLPRAS